MSETTPDVGDYFICSMCGKFCNVTWNERFGEHESECCRCVAEMNPKYRAEVVSSKDR